MKLLFKVAAPVIFLLSILLIFSARTMPQGKLWEEYSVIYVPAKTSDSLVIQIFNECGIKNFVSLSNQYLPVSLNPYSLEISMFNLNKDDSAYSYYKNRESYFFDKSKNFRLYYIPKTQMEKIPQCTNLLEKNNISYGTDSQTSYPYIVLIILCIAVLCLILFAKRKLLFALSAAAPFLFFVYNPFFPVALSSVLFLLICFYIAKLWNREGWFITLTHQYHLFTMLVLAFVTAFSCGFKVGILSLLLIVSEVSYFYTFYSVESFLRNKRIFVPVFIKPARLISLKDNKIKNTFLSLAVCAVFVVAVFFLSSASSVTSNFSKVLLPSNSSADEKLVQLEDYYNWIWNVKSYPYRSLNSQNERNDIIEFPTYSEDNGKIYESKQIMVYNQSFKDSVYEQIDTLPFNAIEKVLKSEGKDFSGGYKSSDTHQTSLFSIILMIICIFVLLFIYIFIIIDTRNKRIRA